MTDSRAALDMDRLPWLTDERTRSASAEERKPRRKIGWASLIPWALLAVLLVAGVSYWLGMRSMSEPDIFADRPRLALRSRRRRFPNLRRTRRARCSRHRCRR